MKLHLGCGVVYRRGCVNVDMLDATVADMLCDMTALPFADGVFEEVESYHTIEHIGFVGALYGLSESFRAMKPGATLCLETPEADRSFERFLCETQREKRAECLNWIFGHETPGLTHRFLFPRDALHELLERCGFGNIRFEPPQTHCYGEGLRVLATKAASTHHEILAHLRTTFRPFRFPVAYSQVEVMEVEQRVFAPCAALLGRSSLQNADALAQLAKIALVSLPAVHSLVALAQRYGVWEEEETLPLLSRLERLDSGRVQNGLLGAFRRLCEDDTCSDAYEAVCRFAIDGIGCALVSDKEEDLSEAFRRLPTVNVPTGRRPLPVFTFAAASDYALRMCAVGVKHFCDGRPEEAQKYFQRSLRSGCECFHACWNLAVLEASTGHFGEAIVLYRQMLAEGAPATSGASASTAPFLNAEALLRLELALLYLRVGNLEEARVVLEPVDATPVKFRIQSLAQSRALYVPVRTEPVLPGEGVYHAWPWPLAQRLEKVGQV